MHSVELHKQFCSARTQVSYQGPQCPRVCVFFVVVFLFVFFFGGGGGRGVCACGGSQGDRRQTRLLIVI